jgi:hypothetical protein
VIGRRAVREEARAAWAAPVSVEIDVSRVVLDGLGRIDPLAVGDALGEELRSLIADGRRPGIRQSSATDRVGPLAVTLPPVASERAIARALAGAVGTGLALSGQRTPTPELDEPGRGRVALDRDA